MEDDSASLKSNVIAFSKQFTAGMFAGIAQILVGHPLDTVKVSFLSCTFKIVINYPIGKTSSAK